MNIWFYIDKDTEKIIRTKNLKHHKCEQGQYKAVSRLILMLHFPYMLSKV